MTSEASGTRAMRQAGARRFLGWRMVAVAFAAQFVFSATGLGIVGNLVRPLAEAFSVARAGVVPTWTYLKRLG